MYTFPREALSWTLSQGGWTGLCPPLQGWWLGLGLSSLPAPGPSPNRFFHSLCVAVFHWRPTQSPGELRSDFQPLALDFLSFVAWTIDYTTQFPVISAPGLPCPGTSPLQEAGKSFLEQEDRGSAFMPNCSDPPPVEHFLRSPGHCK